MTKERNINVDILKIFSLFHMVFDHLYITLYKNTSSNLFFDFFYEIIPLCPAIFLFFSGYSLAINDNYKKIKKRIVFSCLFIITSQIFFLFEHQIQYPHIPFSTGILNTIGLFIISTVIIMKIFNVSFYVILTLVLVVIFILLDLLKISIFPFTYGYEPYFPTIIFGFLGFTFYYVEKNKFLNKLFFIVSIFGVIIISIAYGPFNALYTEFGKNILNFEFKRGLDYYTATIWNFNTLSFLFSISFIITIYNLLKMLKIKINQTLLLPSRFLYFSYIFHLSLIGILTFLLGYSILNTFYFVILYLTIIILIYLLLIIYTKFSKHYHGISNDSKSK